MSDLVVTGIGPAPFITGDPPAPVTDLTVTPLVDGSPMAHVTWEHDGADADRFEVLWRLPDDEWRRAIIAEASFFHTGGDSYEYDMVLLEGSDVVVLVLDVDGDRSV